MRVCTPMYRQISRWMGVVESEQFCFLLQRARVEDAQVICNLEFMSSYSLTVAIINN